MALMGLLHVQLTIALVVIVVGAAISPAYLLKNYKKNLLNKKLHLILLAMINGRKSLVYEQ